MAYIQDVQESVPALPEAGNLTSFVVLSQNENGRKLLFKIVGIDIPSGSTATFSGTKPDGVVYSTTGTISGNIVTVNEDIQMTAVAGSWDAKIRVLNGGNVIASAKVRITIDADPVAPGSIPSDSQLDGIVAECQAYAEEARSSAYGSPLTASTAAGMIDKTRVYVYTGSETGYTNGHWYYWDGTAWIDGGTYNSSGIQTDTTLSVPGMAADAKAAGDEISDLKQELENISGISDDVKEALLQIASKVAYIDDDGQDYYDALEAALYPPADLVSISAVYTQSGAVCDTDSLDSLKDDLVVTALYSDQTTQTVTSYTLSGTLEVGTSTITVSYGGKTTTFNVTVTEPTVLTGYTEVGSPTISDNILTVGDGKFIKTNIPFAPSSDPWEVVIKYRKTAAFGSYTDIIGTVDSSNASSRGFLFEINNGTGTKGAMFASSNGSSWNIMSTENVEPLPEPTSWLWISMAFTGTAYVLKTSTDGETWTTQKEKASSTPIYDDGYHVGFGLKRNGYIIGDVDLTGCRIYKNGILWWKAVA